MQEMRGEVECRMSNVECQVQCNAMAGRASRDKAMQARRGQRTRRLALFLSLGLSVSHRLSPSWALAGGGGEICAILGCRPSSCARRPWVVDG